MVSSTISIGLMLVGFTVALVGKTKVGDFFISTVLFPCSNKILHFHDKNILFD